MSESENDQKRNILKLELLEILKDPAAADAAAAAMWPAFQAKQRSHQQTEQDHRLWPVVLQDGEEVTSDPDGTEIWGGPSRFARLNFLEADVHIHDSYTRNQVDIRARAGGGTDCMFDYLVSECWADEVTAGRGTEGQAFTSLTGCTFYVASTVTKAINDVNALGDIGRMYSIYVCAGEYPEVLPTTTVDLLITGAGRGNFSGNGTFNSVTEIGGATSSSPTWTLGSPPVRIEFRNLSLKNSTSGNLISWGVTNELFLDHCSIRVEGPYKGITKSGVNAQYLWVNDCEFVGHSGAVAAVYADSANSFVKMSHCWVRGFSEGLVVTARAQLSEIYIGITDTAPRRGLTVKGGSGGAKNFQSSNIYIDGNSYSSSVGVFIDGSSGSDNIHLNGVQIRDCTTGIAFEDASVGNFLIFSNINMDGVTTGINFGTPVNSIELIMYDCHGVSLSGSGGPRSKRIYDCTGANGEKIDTVMGNAVLGMLNHRAFSRTLSWGQFYLNVAGTRVSVAAGTHTYAVFDGNTYYVSVSITGTMNVTTTGSFTAGEIPIGIVVMDQNRIDSIDHYDMFFPVSGTGAPMAPNDAQFLTLATSTGLTAERVFTPRYNLYATDGGANGNYTVDSWLEGATITPSAGTLTLGTDGDVFHVAAGNFSAIATPTRQTLVVLVYDGVSVITHGANLILAGAANYTTAAGDTSIFLWEGSTVWRELSRWPASSSAGGVGAHDFVGAEHAHDTDYTQTPNVDGLGVGGGDIDIYSDNGSTQTAEWDSTTGHIAIGVSVDANRAINVNKTIASSEAKGILAAVTSTLATGGTVAGLSGSASCDAGSGTQGFLEAIHADVVSANAAAVTNLHGLYTSMSSLGAGAISVARAVFSEATWGGDVPATIYGFSMGDLGGTGATVRPLYIPAQTGLTNTDVFSLHQPPLLLGDANSGALRIGGTATPDYLTPLEIFLAETVSNYAYNIIHIRPTITDDTAGVANKVGLAMQPVFQFTAAGAYTGNVHAVRSNPNVKPSATTTLTAANCFLAQGSLGSDGTITTWRGYLASNPSNGSGGTIGTLIGMQIDAMTSGAVNIGIANSSNSRQTGYARFGSQTIPTNQTDGDVTAARLFLADGAVLATGAIANITGPIALAEAAAPGTPSADAIAIFNETNSDALKMIDDTGDVWRLSHKHVINCTVDGTVTNQKTVVGPMPHAGEVFNVYSKTCDGVTIGATDWKGDVYLIPAANANTDGGTTSIFSGSLPTIADMYQSYGAPNTTAFAEGDYFSFATTQVGSSATMVTMSLHVRFA